MSRPLTQFLQSPACAVFLTAALVVACGAAHAGDLVKAEVGPGACAALKDGRTLFLECRPPKGNDAETFFGAYLSDPNEWHIYRDRAAVAIRFERLKPEAQRRVLLAVFEADYVDNQGWWHTALCSGKQGQETLWALCEWVTGKGTNYRQVMADKRNKLEGTVLERGQRVLIPKRLLLEVMQEPTPKRAKDATALGKSSDTGQAEAREAESEEEGPVDLDAITNELEYGSDAQGGYAVYRLKQGEALYTAVVVRFTDIRDNASILDACEIVRKRSGIKDVTGMKPGQRILIPQDMLSDRFTPKGSEPRKEYEESVVESKRLRKDRLQTKDLDGVVVVLDPGHGGRDRGCANEKRDLYEDELNYDVACRVKRILETETRATVYITVRDKRQGFEPTDRSRFSHDKTEVVQTTPPYECSEAKTSANLRWYLANAIYRDELKKGVDPRKVVFTSFHTEKLFRSSMRGAMIYIPGARYRRDSEEPEGTIYAHYKESRDHREAKSTAAERRRDEALSRNLAEDVMAAFGRNKIRRHREGDWIRSQIRQDGGQVYVPAVLRNALIPTKILIESANMSSDADCDRLADPKWRQAFAEAYVEGLKSYFGS